MQELIPEFRRIKEQQTRDQLQNWFDTWENGITKFTHPNIIRLVTQQIDTNRRIQLAETKDGHIELTLQLQTKEFQTCRREEPISHSFFSLFKRCKALIKSASSL